MAGRYFNRKLSGATLAAFSLCAAATARQVDDVAPLELDFLGSGSSRHSAMNAEGFSLFDPAQGEVALASFSPVSLQAAQEETAKQAGDQHVGDEYHFEVSLAMWLPGIDGTVGARGVTTDVSATFLDIFDSAHRLFGIGGSGQYRGDKFGAYLTGYWSIIEIEQDIPTGTLEVDNELGLVGFGVLYEVGRWAVERTAEGDLPARDMVLTAYAGGRWSSVEVTFEFPILPDVSKEESWVDPIIGAELRLPLSQQWSIVAGGEVGGFGVSSDFAWSAAAAISYDFHLKRLPASLQLGYLAIGDDYTTGSGTDEFVWDTILHGLLINFAVRF